jgi:hypothetical protein
LAKFKAPADTQMQIEEDQEAQAEVPTTQMQITQNTQNTQNTQKPDAKKSDDMSSTKPAAAAAAIVATWSRMYPDGVLRPRFNPADLKKLCPAFSSNPVLYKSYCSYKVNKKSVNQNALTLEAFE